MLRPKNLEFFPWKLLTEMPDAEAIPAPVAIMSRSYWSKISCLLRNCKLQKRVSV